MNRKVILLGVAVAIAAAAGIAAVSSHTNASACDETTTTAATSSCCAKKDGAATATAAKSACTRSAVQTAASSCCAGMASAVTASAAGCDKSTAAAAGPSCDKSTAAAAGAGCANSAVAAGGDACCKSKATSAAAKAECQEACEKTKTAAIKGVIDELPYRENKRVVLAGSYACAHCTLKATETCAPMFKTTDGKIYPLIVNPMSAELRGVKSANGLEIATTVKKIDGIKYLEVKSFKAL